jgi:hypothetical protein
MTDDDELRSLIRAVAAEHPNASPGDLAPEVADRTPKALMRDFYTRTLASYISDVLRADRGNAMDKTFRRGRKPNPSSKLSDRRDWWKALMASRIYVGDGKWKPLGTCTTDDLKFCIQERMNDIAQLEQTIDNYEHLLMLMRRHRAATVADLPKDAVRNL